MLHIVLLCAVIVAELIALFFLCKPRPKADAPESALYCLQEAAALLPAAATRRDYKKLLSLVARAHERIDRAKLQDIYDLDDVSDDVASVKRLCGALFTVCPQDPAPYTAYLCDAISTCSQRLALRIGGDANARISRKSLPYTARKERAKRLLESIKQQKNDSDLSGQ